MRDMQVATPPQERGALLRRQGVTDAAGGLRKPPMRAAGLRRDRQAIRRALRKGIIVLLLWAIIAAGSSLILWFGSKVLPPALVGAIFVASLILAFITAATGVLALFTLREILAK